MENVFLHYYVLRGINNARLSPNADLMQILTLEKMLTTYILKKFIFVLMLISSI